MQKIISAELFEVIKKEAPHLLPFVQVISREHVKLERRINEWLNSRLKEYPYLLLNQDYIQSDEVTCTLSRLKKVKVLSSGKVLFLNVNED